MTRATDPLRARLERRGVLILDGALATELERAGFDLDHPLWSARVLMESNGVDAIGRVHRSYLDAGADVVISASYQASIEGFLASGASRSEAEELFRESIRIASRARDAFARERDLGPDDRPLVAASIGPWGAAQADGSEYTGNYDVGSEELERFHRERLELVAEELATGRADLVACETIPSLDEALLLARILEQMELVGWMSFSCRDGESNSEGQPITTCARELEGFERLVALGVNCTAPVHCPSLLAKLRGATAKPLLCYPNSGETYEADGNTWCAAGSSAAADPVAWHEAGAVLIGGCCRTTPEDIAHYRARSPASS